MTQLKRVIKYFMKKFNSIKRGNDRISKHALGIVRKTKIRLFLHNNIYKPIPTMYTLTNDNDVIFF